MSAWYVFSALGFYPVNPADGHYVFGSPLIDKATIAVGKNKRLTVTVINNSPRNRYIQKISFQNKPWLKSFITHGDITKGGELVITMGAKPTIWYSKNSGNR